MLEQAHSAPPTARKTAKMSPQSDSEAVRRNQMIWLARQSLGKDMAITNKTPTSHQRPWTTNRPQDAATKGNASWEGPTVWPHL